mmetsp:Transcript_9627/g.30522  ORF Transcript_9627/g.30522 Transcript_9627/m.30522 type:complete len:251 (+) Transcript_9627:473-1225(+)
MHMQIMCGGGGSALVVFVHEHARPELLELEAHEAWLAADVDRHDVPLVEHHVDRLVLLVEVLERVVERCDVVVVSISSRLWLDGHDEWSTETVAWMIGLSRTLVKRSVRCAVSPSITWRRSDLKRSRPVSPLKSWQVRKVSASSSLRTSTQNSFSCCPHPSFSFASPSTVLLTILLMSRTTRELLWKLFDRIVSSSCTLCMKCVKLTKRKRFNLLRRSQRVSSVSRGSDSSVRCPTSSALLILMVVRSFR